MLNQTGVTRKTYGATKSFIVDMQNSTAVSCMVSSTGLAPDEEGNKVVKMGTPVTGDLTNRDEPFTVDSAGTNPVGLIVHDVVVEGESANSQVLVFGTIDISKVDEDVKTMIEAAKSKLKMITVISR